MRPETAAGHEDRFDFSDEERTQPDGASMAELMDSMVEEMREESIRMPGIPTHTSERPTRPIRPMVRWKEEKDE